MELHLTAFVSKAETLQLTVITKSTLPNQSGCAYITLSKDECENLILALRERLDGNISDTNDEMSKYLPYIDD